MTSDGWRTVIVSKRANISLHEGCLVIASEGTETIIPVDEIQTIIIENDQSALSTASIVKLTEANAKIIICNKKHTPICETQPYISNRSSSGNIIRQASWDAEMKDIIWNRIVNDKISGQMNVIKEISPVTYKKLGKYKGSVHGGDCTNREAQAARVYFTALFGAEFKRETECSVNSALNYGYSIVLSHVNRLVAIYGYTTALGIKHCSKANPYNLSCDIMEPFRPVVDKYVFAHKSDSFDAGYRKALVSLLYSEVNYNGNITTVSNVIEMYTNDILKSMSTNKNIVKELNIAA